MLQSELISAALVRLLEYWTARQGPDGEPPPRAALDPLALPPAVLPQLILMELVPGAPGGDPYRFHYRLVGTGIVELFGFDPTGRYLDEIGDTPEIRVNINRLNYVAEARQPHLSRSPFMIPSREFIHVERLTLPFLRADGTVGFLLTALSPIEPPV
ncbi:MAG: PAS domain-containing protein [Ferrovibrio sp.]